MKLYRIERPVARNRFMEIDPTGYSLDGYGLYAYDEYPRGSVLAGQQRRAFLGRFDTLIEAVRACPDRAAMEIDRDVS